MEHGTSQMGAGQKAHVRSMNRWGNADLLLQCPQCRWHLWSCLMAPVVMPGMVLIPSDHPKEKEKSLCLFMYGLACVQECAGNQQGLHCSHLQRWPWKTLGGKSSHGRAWLPTLQKEKWLKVRTHRGFWEVANDLAIWSGASEENN